MCGTGGEPLAHSKSPMLVSKITRLEVRDSKSINRKSIKDNPDKIDPKEDIVLYNTWVSAKSEYRRGIPFRPRKCCGRKVMLTPTNMLINWILNKREL